jgi:hypothetical protein
MPTLGQFTTQQQQLATKAARPAISALQAQRQPLIDRYQGTLDRLAEREQGLAGITAQIAGLRSQALQTGISNALSLFQNQRQRRFAARQAELDRAAALRRSQLAASSGRGSPTPSFTPFTPDTKDSTQPVALGTAARNIAANSRSYQEARARVAKLRGLSSAEKKSLIKRISKLFSKLTTTGF